MHFCVTQAPLRCYGFMSFQNLLQQQQVLIHTYCTSSCRWAIYFWTQDSRSHCRTSKHHWRACRSSTLYANSTSSL